MSVNRALPIPTVAPARPGRPPAPHPLPRPLAALRAGECRYCVADAPAGEMHRALFCAAPARNGPYCVSHRRRCSLPNDADLDTLVAEIDAVLSRRR